MTSQMCSGWPTQPLGAEMAAEISKDKQIKQEGSNDMLYRSAARVFRYLID